MTNTIISIALAHETDVVLARQHARQIAAALELDSQDQTRVATAVSEIARNAFRYAREGKVVFRLDGVTSPQVLAVEVTDRGPGIADLDAVLEGRYRSGTGMGLGIAGTRRLMDRFTITSSPAGTTVSFGKILARRRGVVRPDELAAIAQRIGRSQRGNPIDEIQAQNQELLRALEELSKRQEELVGLNRELEDTNRGVVALYAELDERADHLRRADEVKSKFLSNMSHEFRTPVNSIQALTRLLLERSDGDLTSEQERQLRFIQTAADGLSELVNDLLDLAKAEAGKIEIHPVEFEVTSLFGALRGMLRPLLVNEAVSLVFEEPKDLPHLYSDESKVSQILRNFISNALKFTERGEVRVSARVVADGHAVAFAVRDTGIGVAAEDHEHIFKEFTQVDSPVQRRVKGTGLGLPLCRRLAELLGGTVSVDSEPGRGSTFTAVVPLRYAAPLPQPNWEIDPTRIPVLVVEDRAETVMLYDKLFMGAGFQLVAARNLREARQALEAVRPTAVILDILLQGEDSWEFLAELKRRPDTSDIPVVVVSTVADERKGIALGADAYFVKPFERSALLGTLCDLTRRASPRRILLVDDEEMSRYVLRQHLAAPDRVVVEAGSGEEGLRRARTDRPDVVCLDLGMPDVDGFEVLRRLKADPLTRGIPVIIVTARDLSAGERSVLHELGAGILSKHTISRDTAVATIADAVGGGGREA
jgi:signal transduction histidine kinase/CheY-like chemotaxis protein